MTQSLKASSQRVQEFLRANNKALNVVELPDSTRTAQEAANAIGCEVAEIAKSIVFKNGETGAPVLVVASGVERVSTQKIATLTHITLKKADADFVKKELGFVIGGVPPISHDKNVKVLLDENLKNMPSIWAAAGTPNSVFELTPQDLFELTQGEWLDLVE